MRRISLLMIAGSMSACATATKAPTPEPPAPTEQLLGLPSGEPVDEDALAAALKGAKIVFVGEQHTSPEDHAVQLEVLKLMYAQDPSIGIGVEMVARPFQPVLDAFSAGQIPLAELPERLEWSTRWGYDFSMYAPIFEFAQRHQLPMYALNAPRGLSRKIARGGVESLSEEERAALPELDLSIGAHRDAVQRVFDAHMSGHGNFKFENFYAAQVLWDETMAETAAKALSAEGGPARLIVFAGAGHISLPGAMPPRAARRGARPQQAVIPYVLGDAQREPLDELKAAPVDFIWLRPAASK